MPQIWKQQFKWRKKPKRNKTDFFTVELLSTINILMSLSPQEETVMYSLPNLIDLGILHLETTYDISVPWTRFGKSRSNRTATIYLGLTHLSLMLGALYTFSHCVSITSSMMGLIITTSQAQKTRFRRFQLPAQGHTARKVECKGRGQIFWTLNFMFFLLKENFKLSS